MVKAEEIRDRESLRAWLEGRPPKDAAEIALRAACRVLPVFGGALSASWARNADVSMLPLFRLFLNSSVAIRMPQLPLDGISNVFDDPLFKAAMSGGHEQAARAVEACRGAADSADAARLNAIAENTNANYGGFARGEAPSVAVSAEKALPANAHGQIWASVREDAGLCESGRDLFHAQLWATARPKWFQTAGKAMRNCLEEQPEIWFLEEKPEVWGFWLRWWDGVVSGNPLPWDLQEKVALIEPETWEQGAEAVAAEIARIRAGLAEPGDPDQELNDAIRRMDRPENSIVRSVQAAMERNREELPATFDAIEGLIALEIEREQTRNHVDDLDVSEAKRRISVLLALHSAISRLRATVPVAGAVPVANAEEAEKILRFYGRKFASLPRAKADEVVESVWETTKGLINVGLILGSGVLAARFGLPPIGGIVAGSMVFAPKNAADIIKAAKEYVAPGKPGA